jgi:hypothetical protein
MTGMVLVVLCVLDGGFSGFRVSAGRNGRIDKRLYYRKWIMRGLLVGVGFALFHSAAMLALVGLSPDPTETFDALMQTGGTLAIFLGAYAALVGLAFLPYLLGGPDLRTLATVIVFGPLTLLRPAVLVASLVLGLNDAPSSGLGHEAIAVVFTVQLLLEPLLDRWIRRAVASDAVRASPR